MTKDTFREEFLAKNPQILKTYKAFKKSSNEVADKYLDNILAKKYSKKFKKEVIKESKPKTLTIKIKPHKAAPELEPEPPKLQKSQLTPQKKSNYTPRPRRALIRHPITNQIKSIAEWADYIGINYATFKYRLDRYGNIPEIFLSKREFDEKMNLYPKKQIIYDLSEQLGLSIPQIRHRVKTYGEDPTKWPIILDKKRIISAFTLGKKYGITESAVYYRLKKYGPEQNWPDYKGV